MDVASLADKVVFHLLRHGTYIPATIGYSLHGMRMPGRIVVCAVSGDRHYVAVGRILVVMDS